MKNLTGKYVHCETMDQAKELMKEAEKQGFNPLNPLNFLVYDKDTVYSFNNKPNRAVGYCNKDFYENERKEVVEFRDMLGDDSAAKDIEYLILSYLDSLHINELLREKIRLSKMILNYEE